MPKEKKTQKEKTEFFTEMISVYFRFYENNFGLKPSFDGSAPRDLKMIVEAMKSRSLENGVEWTLQIAEAMLNKFLEYAIKEVWLKENFFLFNLNRQKDKIFFKIKSQNNGTSKDGFTRDGIASEFSRRYSKER